MRGALLVVALLAGCFSPRFADGAFVCGPGDLCPEGTSCSPVDHHCHAGVLSPVGGNGGMSGSDLSLPASSDGPLPSGSDDLALPPNPDLASVPFFGSGALGDLDLSHISGVVHCNTETGEMIVDAGNVAVVHAGQAGFAHLSQSSGPAVALWNFRDVTIPAGVILKPSSSSASVPVLAATGTMSIAGTIDWSGYGGLGAGPGAGGGNRASGVSSGGGAAYGTDGSGGGGAGYTAKGGLGGGIAPGSAGAIYGSTDLHIVHFGSGGGGGGNGSGGVGGNGGGALVLLAQSLTLAGKLDVSALDGSPGSGGVAGGGGGGSGGSLLISTNSLLLDSGHQLSAALGKGGQPSTGGGFGGGDGSVGRVFIATPSLVVTGGGAPNSTPQANVLASTLSSFPR
jgi:hypothetical protein